MTDLVAGKYTPENTVPVLPQLLAKFGQWLIIELESAVLQGSFPSGPVSPYCVRAPIQYWAGLGRAYGSTREAGQILAPARPI